ncbi:hypothetical protein [Leuconostoc inhae]|nr:hypothetical protein [Leuconostoc inhae]
MISYVVSDDKVPHKERLGRMPYELALDVQALIGGKIYAIDDVERSITKIDEGDEHD